VINQSERPLTDNTQHSQQTGIHAPRWVSNPQSQTYVLDRAATGTGNEKITSFKSPSKVEILLNCRNMCCCCCCCCCHCCKISPHNFNPPSVSHLNVIRLRGVLILILGSNQLDALFHVFIYFMSLHVSSVTAFIIRRSNCINTSSGMISLCK